MVDLATTKAQTGQTQDKALFRQESFLPNRINTNQPDFQGSASMRTADRGDGGAAQLRQVFGIVNNASDSFTEYANAKQAKTNEADAAQGALDAANNQVDQDKLAHSNAYHKAVSLGNAQSQTYEMLNGLHDHIDGLLNGDHPATLDEVNEAMSKQFTDFGVLDGKPRDFGSPEANLKVAPMLQEARVNTLENARGVIKKQVDMKALDTAGSNMTNDVARGKPLDFEGALSQVPPGVDRKTAKATLATAVVNAARGMQDSNPDQALSIMDQLLGSKKADGTSSLSTDERESLLQERRSMGNQIKVAKDEADRKRWDANSDGVMNSIMGVPGSKPYPSMGQIASMVASGDLDSEHGHALMNMVKSDQREAASAAREARSEARAEAAEARAAQQDAADAVGQDILGGLYAGTTNVSAAQGALLKAAGDGHFGTGAVRQRAISKVMTQIGQVKSARQGLLETPEYRNGLGDIQSMYNKMLADMNSRALPTATRARGKIWLNKKLKEAQTLYGQATVDQGNATAPNENILHSWSSQYFSIFGSTRKTQRP